MTPTNALASNQVIQNLYWSQLEKTQLDDDTREKGQSLVAAIANIMDSYDASKAATEGNGELSALGRANALQSVSAASLKKLESMATPILSGLDRQIVDDSNALRNAAAKINGGPDSAVVIELRSVEARAAFAALPNLDLARQNAYLSLCASGTDDISALAVENSSAFAPLLDAETIERGRAIRGARSLPDRAASLDSASELKAILSAAVGAARRHISLGPIGGDPLIIGSQSAADLEAA